MKTSALYTVLATCAALATASVMGGGVEEDTTTTMTSTIYMTYTITSCAPDVPDCPANKSPPTPTPEPEPYVPEPEPESEPTYPTTSATTSSEAYPTEETSSEYETSSYETSSYEMPTVDYTKPPTLVTSTSVVDAVPLPSSTLPVQVPVSGASSVGLSQAMALGVLALSAALLN